MVFYGAEQKVALVEQYICPSHGSKQAWIAEHGISKNMMAHWRRAFSSW